MSSTTIVAMFLTGVTRLASSTRIMPATRAKVEETEETGRILRLTTSMELPQAVQDGVDGRRGRATKTTSTGGADIQGEGLETTGTSLEARTIASTLLTTGMSIEMMEPGPRALVARSSRVGTLHKNS